MSSRVFWGFILILVGGLALASNLGMLTWGVWHTLVRAWPVLLILWGLSVLLRPLGRTGALVAAVVVLAAAVGVVAWAVNTTPASPELATYQLDQPLAEGIERVDLGIGFGAGTLVIDAAAPAGRLATGTLEYVGFEPDVDYRAQGATADLDLRLDASGRISGPVNLGSLDWDIHLSPVPVYALDLDTGACEARLDLSGLKVAEFDLDTGAASTVVTFGDQGLDLAGQIDQGAASLVIRLPRSVGVRFELSSGLGSSNLASAGFERSGSEWVSEGYAERATHFVFRVNQGVSSLTVEWID